MTSSVLSLSDRCSVVVKYGKFIEFTKYYPSTGANRYVKYSLPYYNALKETLDKLVDCNIHGTAEYFRVGSSDPTQDSGHDYLFSCSHYQGDFFTGLFFCVKDSGTCERVGGGLNLTPHELFKLSEEIKKIDGLWDESIKEQSSPSKRQKLVGRRGLHEPVEIKLYGYKVDGSKCKWFASKELAYEGFKKENLIDSVLPDIEELSEPSLNITHVIRILFFHKVRSLIRPVPEENEFDDSDICLFKGTVQVKDFTETCKTFFELIDHPIDSTQLYTLCYSCVYTSMEPFPLRGNYKFQELVLPPQ